MNIARHLLFLCVEFRYDRSYIYIFTKDRIVHKIVMKKRSSQKIVHLYIIHSQKYNLTGYLLAKKRWNELPL